MSCTASTRFSPSETNLNEQSLVPEQLTETDSTVYESDTEPRPTTADLDTEAPATDLDDEQLLILLEGLLFVASEPAAIERLATALNVSIERVAQGLDQLETQLLNQASVCSGIMVQHSWSQRQRWLIPLRCSWGWTLIPSYRVRLWKRWRLSPTNSL